MNKKVFSRAWRWLHDSASSSDWSLHKECFLYRKFFVSNHKFTLSTFFSGSIFTVCRLFVFLLVGRFVYLILF